MTPDIIVIGAGPAGLIAAEFLARAGLRVAVHDQMPSVGRKFLMAGRGGLNLTHSEPLDLFLTRYAPAAAPLLDAVRAFPPSALIAWCEGLGIPTLVGSSGRVFPQGMKASPLLRAWLRRLAELGVEVRPRSRWLGRDADGGLRFSTEEAALHPRAVVLAMGGASWPRLGSDGAWPALLPGVPVLPFAPSNMGVTVPWSAPLLAKHEGAAVKRIAIRFAGATARGDAVVTRAGLEGGAIYALSGPIRDAVARDGSAMLSIDLRPDLTAAAVAEKLGARGRAESVSTVLRKAAGLSPVAIGLVQEALHAGGAGRGDLAALVKALPLRVTGVSGLARAISSAGGLAWEALDENFMLKALPGTFACGEMLDWEAPTGGYLLQGCFATGVAAAKGVLARL
ncbi:BaiN/RdsA family NAD(P)/FAD-dependent oxidoreductase [Falsiroseomonas ponticola]|uniref:NAD(P)/FAD-dependent oxidoreductase n=1 Tax=Falsiroseomonas ponticola TaxID=2786951 RepID=UPI00193177A3|nr:TIGR03862 family flavoprotein [Roseomonas ponticola]